MLLQRQKDKIKLIRHSFVVMKDVKLVYVLLDGVGDLPHPSLNDLTPLGAAYTPNLDTLARNGAMGNVISVGRE